MDTAAATTHSTQLTATPITLPALNDGERWIGVSSVGTKLHHVILLPGDFEGPHAAMMAKVHTADADLEAALLAKSKSVLGGEGK